MGPEQLIPLVVAADAGLGIAMEGAPDLEELWPAARDLALALGSASPASLALGVTELANLTANREGARAVLALGPTLRACVAHAPHRSLPFELARVRLVQELDPAGLIAAAVEAVSHQPAVALFLTHQVPLARDLVDGVLETGLATSTHPEAPAWRSAARGEPRAGGVPALADVLAAARSLAAPDGDVDAAEERLRGDGLVRSAALAFLLATRSGAGVDPAATRHEALLLRERLLPRLPAATPLFRSVPALLELAREAAAEPERWGDLFVEHHLAELLGLPELHRGELARRWLLPSVLAASVLGSSPASAEEGLDAALEAGIRMAFGRKGTRLTFYAAAGPDGLPRVEGGLDVSPDLRGARLFTGIGGGETPATLFFAPLRGHRLDLDDCLLVPAPRSLPRLPLPPADARAADLRAALPLPAIGPTGLAAHAELAPFAWEITALLGYGDRDRRPDPARVEVDLDAIATVASSLRDAGPAAPPDDLLAVRAILRARARWGQPGALAEALSPSLSPLAPEVALAWRAARATLGAADGPSSGLDPVALDASAARPPITSGP